MSMLVGDKKTREPLYFGDAIDAGTAVGVRFRNIAAVRWRAAQFLE